MQGSPFDYNQRTAEQIAETLRAVLPNAVPEISFDEADPLYRSLIVFAWMTEMLHYYIDNTARESLIDSAELFPSVVRGARGVGYRVRGSVPHQALLTFTLSANAPSDVLIPQNTIVETVEGVPYRTIADATIVTGSTATSITAVQETLFSGQLLGITDGTAGQILLISESLVDGSVVLTIGAETYTPVETFFYSLPADTHFIQGVNADGVNEILLGDGVNGKLPTAGQNIEASYALTKGADGYARANTITDIISTITLPPALLIACTNPLASSGGGNRQSVAEIKRGVNALVRTTNTAVSRETYIWLGYLIPGVEKVGVFYEFGSIVDVFVLPKGGGLATPLLLSQVEAFYETRRMILTRVRASSAGEVRVLLTLNITLKPNGVRVLVEQSILATLQDLGSIANQDITGVIHSGKIDQLAYNVVGVQDSVIEVFSLVPYARPITASENLNWSVEMLEGCAATVRWRVEFTGATSFRLLRQDLFVGNFTTGIPITYNNEVRFTIRQNYTAGDAWTFTTYAYLGKTAGAYRLEEPSILRIYANDITINFTGGI
jgi:hypothetical protein